MALTVASVILGVEAPTVVVRGTIDEVIRLVSDEGLKTPDQEDPSPEIVGGDHWATF